MYGHPFVKTDRSISFTLAGCRLSRIMNATYIASGSHFDRTSARQEDVGGPLTEPVVSDLVAAGESGPAPIFAVNMHRFHGAATRVAVPSTAVGTRQEHFMTEIIAAWNPRRTARRADPMGHRDGRPAGAALNAPGGPDMLGADAHKQIAEAYGPNAPRLRELKARFDAGHVFTAIPLPH